jgi:hypothetical protein
MGVLIDHTNYNLYFKQSTQSRTGTPDGNVYFNPNGEVELIGADELPTFDHSSIGGGANDTNQLTNFDGFTMRGIYNFENQERRVDENLRKFVKATKGNYRQAGAYSWYQGSKIATDSGRAKVRQSGYVEFSDINGTQVNRTYHGIGSLVDIQPTTVPYYALVENTDEASLQAATWTNFQRVGDIDETIQTFGDTQYGDAGAGDFDFTNRTLIIRVRSWGYLAGETDSVKTKIAELSGFTAGYGVGESINSANTYNLADVYGGSQVAPWNGMSLEKLTSPQVETGFVESDGDFTWVLRNTNGGTVQECAAFLDALALQDGNIDDGTGTYNGKYGRVWYIREAGKVVTQSIDGEGLFIEGLTTAEKQNAVQTDDAGNGKTYPFFPTILFDVGASASTAPNAFWHVFYVDGDSDQDFDKSNAVTVNDASGNPMKGVVVSDVSGTVIATDYDFAGNTQAGLNGGVDKQCVIIVEGDGDVAQAITFFTISQQTTIPVTCAPELDPNA